MLQLHAIIHCPHYRYYQLETSLLFLTTVQVSVDLLRRSLVGSMMYLPLGRIQRGSSGIGCAK